MTIIQQISKKEIYKRIAVREPYFALQDIEQHGEELRARIQAEQPLGYELEPVSTGEISRHLALLGSCAIAIMQDNLKQNYHLANNATITRNISKIKTKDLVCTAKAEFINKHKVIAYTKLFANNIELANLKIYYTILSQKVFERQFAKYKQDLRVERTDKTSRQNLYKQLFFTPYFNTKKNKVMLNMGIIRPNMCMGHFPQYPALPIAFSSSILIKIAISFLQEKFRLIDHKFFVNFATITAHKLIFAGANIDVMIEFLDKKEDEYIFKTQMLNAKTKDILIELTPLHLKIGNNNGY